MTDWKHSRIRKVVDYSKFISQDSDDDDFSDHAYTRPAKKSKLSSSDKKDKKTQSDTQSSKKMDQESPTQSKRSSRQKADAIANGVGEENAKQSSVAVLREADDEIQTVDETRPNKNDASSSEFTKIVSVIDTDDSETSIRDFDEGTVKKSDAASRDAALTEDATETNANDDQNKIVSRNKSETRASIKDKQCNRRNVTSDCAEIVCPVNTSPQSFTVKQSVMPKWKAPGPASQNSSKSENEGCSKSFMGLRLGLSRNTRVKPLHANVKVQQ